MGTVHEKQPVDKKIINDLLKRSVLRISTLFRGGNMPASFSVVNSSKVVSELASAVFEFSTAYGDASGCTPSMGNYGHAGYYLVDRHSSGELVFLALHQCNEELTQKLIIVHAFGELSAAIAEK